MQAGKIGKRTEKLDDLLLNVVDETMKQVFGEGWLRVFILHKGAEEKCGC